MLGFLAVWLFFYSLGRGLLTTTATFHPKIKQSKGKGCSDATPVGKRIPAHIRPKKQKPEHKGQAPHIVTEKNMVGSHPEEMGRLLYNFKRPLS